MSNDFHNPNGKIFEIDDACPLCWVYGGLLGGAISLIMCLGNDEPEFVVIGFIGFIVSAICFWKGWKNKDKNTKYIINSKNDTFFIPLRDEAYCKLSDIETVNERVSSYNNRKMPSENIGFENGRNRTKYTYYVQIKGQNISHVYSFSNPRTSDELYSSLRVGIKDVLDFSK